LKFKVRKKGGGYLFSEKGHDGLPARLEKTSENKRGGKREKKGGTVLRSKT